MVITVEELIGSIIKSGGKMSDYVAIRYWGEEIEPHYPVAITRYNDDTILIAIDK